MPPRRLFLDCADPQDSGAPWKQPKNDIPEPIRRFGYIPNLSRLEPGDILLFKNVKGGYQEVSEAIRNYQLAKEIPSESARWTHAAIYVQDVYVCEADFDYTGKSGVRYGEFWDYLPNYDIRVRRFPEIGLAGGWQVAANALAQLPSGYDYKYALVHFSKLQNTPLWCKILQKLARWFSERALKKAIAEPDGPKLTICSRLCVEAYQSALFRIWQPEQFNLPPEEEALPGHLDLTTGLQDVDVGWLKIQ